MKEQFEWLDPKRIIRAVAPKNRKYLSRFELVDTIDSTNTYLLAQSKARPQSGWVCLAEEQTQGRGRQGKEWYSPRGTNIYCSLLWNFPLAFKDISALSIACGVIIIQALQKMGVQRALGLKWPNDILCEQRKLAGVLLESRVSSEVHTVVIGVGLNFYLPVEKKDMWVGVDEIAASPVTRNEVVGVLLNELLSGVVLFQAHGLQPFHAMCHAHDVLLHKKIVIHTPISEVVGVAEGISRHGELMFVDEQGRRKNFCYGEVSVRA